MSPRFKDPKKQVHTDATGRIKPFYRPFQSAERFNFFLDRIGVPNESYEADGFGHSAWNYRLCGKSLEVLTLEFLREQMP